MSFYIRKKVFKWWLHTKLAPKRLVESSYIQNRNLHHDDVINKFLVGNTSDHLSCRLKSVCFKPCFFFVIFFFIFPLSFFSQLSLSSLIENIPLSSFVAKVFSFNKVANWSLTYLGTFGQGVTLLLAYAKWCFNM